MALSNEDILNAIAEMSVMDVVELVSAWKRNLVFLHSCSCCCSWSAAAVAVKLLQSKTEFDVVLTAVGDKKVNVLKQFVRLLVLVLKEAKEWLMVLHQLLKKAASKAMLKKLRSNWKKLALPAELK